MSNLYEVVAQLVKVYNNGGDIEEQIQKLKEELETETEAERNQRLETEKMRKYAGL